DGTSQRLRDVTSERPKPIQVIGFISLNRVMMLSPTVSASTGTSPRSVRIMVPVRKHGTASCGAAVPGPHQVSDLSTDPGAWRRYPEHPRPPRQRCLPAARFDQPMATAYSRRNAPASGTLCRRAAGEGLPATDIG